MPTLLNLGCGQRFCADTSWTNVDFNSADGRVIAHDLRRKLPFDDNTFDAVYHSHVLEHFTRSDGRRFVAECGRVLKPAGVLRVAVPDGAQICRLYLDALAKLEAGESEWQGRYDWMMLELYDQTVRTFSGGEMAGYLRRRELPDEDFILARIGNVGREIIDSARKTEGKIEQASVSRRPTWRRWARLLKGGPERWRQQLKLALLSEQEREALSLGLFRLGGEVHQWMYDGHSLRQLLESAGFVDVHRCGATESRIENWATYHLDVDPNGAEHAPSSVYMEARKPFHKTASKSE
ncbi:MAG: methyltransferase domain-containing protein [Acidobacteriota bacterium]